MATSWTCCKSPDMHPQVMAQAWMSELTHSGAPLVLFIGVLNGEIPSIPALAWWLGPLLLTVIVWHACTGAHTTEFFCANYLCAICLAGPPLCPIRMLVPMLNGEL